MNYSKHTHYDYTSSVIHILHVENFADYHITFQFFLCNSSDITQVLWSTCQNFCGAAKVIWSQTQAHLNTQHTTSTHPHQMLHRVLRCFALIRHRARTPWCCFDAKSVECAAIQDSFCTGRVQNDNMAWYLCCFPPLPPSVGPPTSFLHP